MNPCDRWRDRIAEYALGSPAEPRLAEHLAKCPACSAALARMQSVTQAIDSGIRQMAAAEPDANGPVRIAAQAHSKAEQARWWQPVGRTVAAAFAVLIFLAASFGVMWRVRSQRENAEAALSMASRISSWKSPTQELLRSPYESLLSGTPRLGEGFYQLNASGLKTKNSAPRVKENKKQ
jgi:anti-sigma factor RsiW